MGYFNLLGTRVASSTGSNVLLKQVFVGDGGYRRLARPPWRAGAPDRTCGIGAPHTKRGGGAHTSKKASARTSHARSAIAAEEDDERHDSLNLDIPSTPPQEEFLRPILLAFENTRPVEHWLHGTAIYKNALEALRNEPWRDVLEERFAPMVRGAPRGWRRMVKEDALFNWGNLVIFARKQYEGEEEMETDGEDEEMDGENETAEREQAHREPWTWRLDVIPQTPGIDHPVWQDHVSFADIGTLLYNHGITPLQLCLHHSARFI